MPPEPEPADGEEGAEEEQKEGEEGENADGDENQEAAADEEDDGPAGETPSERRKRRDTAGIQPNDNPEAGGEDDKEDKPDENAPEEGGE